MGAERGDAGPTRRLHPRPHPPRAPPLLLLLFVVLLFLLLRLLLPFLLVSASGTADKWTWAEVDGDKEKV